MRLARPLLNQRETVPCVPAVPTGTVSAHRACIVLTAAGRTAFRCRDRNLAGEKERRHEARLRRGAGIWTDSCDGTVGSKDLLWE